MAYLANASNLVLYLSAYMHLSPSNAANNVTDFMGTAFLLALLGGFLSDAFFTTYHIYLISAVIEFLVIYTFHSLSPFLLASSQKSKLFCSLLFPGLFFPTAAGYGCIQSSASLLAHVNLNKRYTNDCIQQTGGGLILFSQFCIFFFKIIFLLSN